MPWIRPTEYRLYVADDCPLRYTVADVGDPVVLLHGWPQSGHESTGLLPQLASQYRVIAPDLRGMGDSTRPLDGCHARMVAAEIDSLLASLDVVRSRIVGHDLGGPVGLPAHRRHRAVCPAVRVHGGPLYGIEAPGVADKLRQTRHIPFFAVPHVPEFFIAGCETAFIESFSREFGSDRSAITPLLVDHYTRIMQWPGALVSGLA